MSEETLGTMPGDDVRVTFDKATGEGVIHHDNGRIVFPSLSKLQHFLDILWPLERKMMGHAEGEGLKRVLDT